MLKINVHADIAEVQRDLKDVEKKIVPQAAARVLNRLNGTVRTRLVRQVQAMFSLPNQRSLRRQIRIPRSFRASARRLRAGGLSSVFIPAIHAPNGVRAVFARGPQPVGSETPFLMTMPSGRRAIFVRVERLLERRTSGRPFTSSPNLPVKEVFTDQTNRALASAQSLISAAGVDWRRRLNAELKFRLERRRSVRR